MSRFDLEEEGQDPGDDEMPSPVKAPETPITAAPSREPTLDAESVFEPNDFVEFLIAADALLEPGDPRGTASSTAFVEKLLAPELKQDPAALSKFAKEEPFPSRWTFWLDVTRPHGMSTKAFKRGLHVLGHLQNVNSFCVEWNELLRGDTFAMYSNLRLFKEGIKPLWEESANKEGGKWVLVFPVDFASEDDAIPDQYIRMFLTLLIYLVCGQIGHDDDICGASISIRTFGIMITVWNRDSHNQASIEYMKERLQELLMTSEEVRYQDHQGTIKQNEAKRKARVLPETTTATKQNEKPDETKKKKPKAMDVSSLSAQPAPAPVHEKPAVPAAIALPPAPSQNPWNKVPTGPTLAQSPPIHSDKPEAPQPPWGKHSAPHEKDTKEVHDNSVHDKPSKSEASKEKSKSQPEKKQPPPTGSLAASGPVADTKATVWGSPLKSYSWADDDATELMTEKIKPTVPKKEEEEKKELKKKKDESKDHPLKSKFSKSSEKVAKIPHVSSVKVSPPPVSKFSESRVDENGHVIKNEEFFYRQRHKDKHEKKPKDKTTENQPKTTDSHNAVQNPSEFNQKLDDAAKQTDDDDDYVYETPKNSEPLDPVYGFEIKVGAAPTTKSFAELAEQAKKDRPAPAPKPAEQKKPDRKELSSSDGKDDGSVKREDRLRGDADHSKKSEATKRREEEARKKEEAAKEKAAKAAEKAAKDAELWKQHDGLVSTLPEVAVAKVDVETESSDEEEEEVVSHPTDGETDSGTKVLPRKRLNAIKTKRKQPKGIEAPSREKKAQKKMKKSVEERILAVEKAPIDPQMIKMIAGVAVVAVLFIFFVVMFS